jgi:hypothetical protein
MFIEDGDVDFDEFGGGADGGGLLGEGRSGGEDEERAREKETGHVLKIAWRVRE